MVWEELRVEYFYEVGEDFFGVADAAFPNVVSPSRVEALGVVKYVAFANGVEFSEAFVALKESFD